MEAKRRESLGSLRAAAGCQMIAPHLAVVERVVEGGTVFERRLEGNSDQPTVVMLHGVPVSSSVFEPLASELRSRMPNPVVFLDLPGLGRSTVSGAVSWSTQRSVLGAWLRDQGGIILVVHDIAGPIVLPLLADERIDVCGLVLLNTILEPSTFRPLVEMRLLRAPAVGGILARVTPRWLYVRRMKALGIARPARVEPGLLERLHAETFRRAGWRGLHQVMRGFELDVQTDEAIARGLAARDIPSLAVWAAADPALGNQRRHLARLLPNCRLQILADARHFLMLDYAVEIAEALVLAGVERW